MTLAQLKQLKQSGEKIACLTAYDANMAHWVAQAGCEVILVGDSLGMVVQGHATTLPVTLEQMVYHTEMVARGAPDAWIVADMPFMSDATLEKGLQAAQALVQAGANMIKVEGGLTVLPLVHRLAELGVPVCGHLGLLPQSVLRHGYRTVEADEALVAAADALVQSGAEMLVLECVRPETAETISRSHAIPVIGIGSGADTDGQVLVLQDVLGLTIGRTPSFARNFLAGADSIQAALAAYVQAVKAGMFPEV
jgi:3-methyl-2-oxobutanoate hydroxymethyltransferase